MATDKLVFHVQGSAPEPYELTFKVVGENRIRCTCTCPAGGSAVPCKHRLTLILEALESETELTSMIKGSPLVAAVLDIFRAEDGLETAKRAVSDAKKKVGRLMKGE
jgi:uncharacterized Zn finger protein